VCIEENADYFKSFQSQSSREPSFPATSGGESPEVMPGDSDVETGRGAPSYVSPDNNWAAKCRTGGLFVGFGASLLAFVATVGTFQENGRVGVLKGGCGLFESANEATGELRRTIRAAAAQRVTEGLSYLGDVIKFDGSRWNWNNIKWCYGDKVTFDIFKDGSDGQKFALWLLVGLTLAFMAATVVSCGFWCSRNSR
jgi:hypothetical protein